MQASEVDSEPNFLVGDDVDDFWPARRKSGKQGAEKAAFIIRQLHRPRRVIDTTSPDYRFGDTSALAARPKFGGGKQNA